MKKACFLLALALCSLAPFLFTGCEAESSADTSLTLNPRSATLRPRQSQLFTVSGGYDYRWTLSDERLGALNRRNGNQVLYTATSTNSGTQLLTVESFIEGGSGGNNSTNTFGDGSNQVATVQGASAQATITQVAD
jgi:hypothetical protein